MQTQMGSAVPAEIARFDALADRWWDPEGPMRPLHRMNPARVDWIDRRLRVRFGGSPVRLLDVGCGGGLAAEALAKRGHKVLGIDLASAALAAAEAHAAGRGLPLKYRAISAESLADEGAHFPVITALELMEHVSDPGEFIGTLARLLEPEGVLFVSTLNRTTRSLLTAKLGAEHVMRILPVGTHDWRRFVTPSELSRHLASAGLRLADIAGLLPDPLRGGWRTGRDTGVNYIAMAQA
jgi:2-polyprenyl-6-hydroxyphenyl methylase/3-demethylubiquinone-9 3-methyltransferase